MKTQTFKHYILVLLLINWLVAHEAFGQQVWPGDVTNNGKVTGVDVLYWGWANGSTGPGRANESTDWSSQVYPGDWSQSFPDGTNFAFADCDGDGIIDEDDLENGIEDNLGKIQSGGETTEGYANASAGSTAIQLLLEPEENIVEPGDMLRLDLSLNLNGQPANDISGVALEVSYSSDLVNSGGGNPNTSFNFELEPGGWFGGGQNEVTTFSRVADDVLGEATAAFTRTDQTAVTIEAGKIGHFNIIIEDIIVGLTVDTLFIQIDSVLMMSGEDFIAIPVIPDSTMVIVTSDKDSLLSTHIYDLTAPDWNVYPNPLRVGHSLMLEWPSGFESPHLELINMQGQTVQARQKQMTSHIQELILPDQAPAGVYMLRAYFPEYGWTQKKIVILAD